MALKFIRWSRKGGEVANLLVRAVDENVAVREDYCVVDAYATQNRLRHALSVLERLDFAGLPAIPDLSDLMVTYDANKREYRLWCYCRNWKTHASFLAGILVGRQHKWRAVARRLSRRKKRAMV